MADVKNNMVHGVAPVLQYLKQIEPELYKEISEDLKSKSLPMRNYVAAGFPNQPWQSATGKVNWSKYGRTTRGRKTKSSTGASFPKYEVKKAQAGVTIQVGGRKVRRTNSYPILRVRQGDAAGAIYDMAAKNSSGTTAGAQFVGNLNGTGQASRVMWKRTKASFPMVQKSVMDSINGIERKFTAQIAAETERRNAQSVRASAQVRNVLGRFGR
jgi:hypothetical protein